MNLLFCLVFLTFVSHNRASDEVKICIEKTIREWMTNSTVVSTTFEDDCITGAVAVNYELTSGTSDAVVHIGYVTGVLTCILSVDVVNITVKRYMPSEGVSATCVYTSPVQSSALPRTSTDASRPKHETFFRIQGRDRARRASCIDDGAATRLSAKFSAAIAECAPPNERIPSEGEEETKTLQIFGPFEGGDDSKNINTISSARTTQAPRRTSSSSVVRRLLASRCAIPCPGSSGPISSFRGTGYRYRRALSSRLASHPLSRNAAAYVASTRTARSVSQLTLHTEDGGSSGSADLLSISVRTSPTYDVAETGTNYAAHGTIHGIQRKTTVGSTDTLFTESTTRYRSQRTRIPDIITDTSTRIAPQDTHHRDRETKPHREIVRRDQSTHLRTEGRDLGKHRRNRGSETTPAPKETPSRSTVPTTQSGSPGDVESTGKNESEALYLTQNYTISTPNSTSGVNYTILSSYTSGFGSSSTLKTVELLKVNGGNSTGEHSAHPSIFISTEVITGESLDDWIMTHPLFILLVGMTFVVLTVFLISILAVCATRRPYTRY